MRAAILARVSTSDQKSIPMQLDEARELCKARGWTVAHEFQEEISGASKKRPGRDALMSLARKRKIDVAIVWRLDRFGRSAPEAILLMDELTSLGVAFVSIKENIDLSTPLGRLHAQLLAIFADFHRSILLENVRAGIAAYRAKNDRWGRRPTLHEKKGQVSQLTAEGIGPTEIAKRLSIGRASVYRLLQK